MKAAAIVVVVAMALTGTADAAIPTSERNALIDLYNGTNGGSWTNRANWRNAGDTDFNDPGTECTWYGVTCNVAGDSVTGVDLHVNGLSGAIPTTIQNLPSLTTLSLWYNQIGGEIPAEIGNLSNLQYLRLDSNQLSGSIPGAIGDLGNLVWLYLNTNNLTGSIPSSMVNFMNLTRLYLNYNSLTGAIPPVLGGLTTLNYLHLEGNHLSGTIPPELGSLIFLQGLHLESNQLSGTIPPELGACTVLLDMDLSDNRLGGSIPPQIGNLGSLTTLNLKSNQLTGRIPGELKSLVNLTSLFLEFNALWTDDPTVDAFVSSFNGTWYVTETVAPSGLGTSFPSSSSLVLGWTPIDYQSDSGFYAVFPDPRPPSVEIFVDDFEGGDTTWWGLGNPWVTTVDKSNTAIAVNGLEPATTYDFVVRTVTEPHAQNQNQVVSDASETVSGTTSAP